MLLKKFLKPDESIDDVIDEHFRFTSSLSLDSPDGQIENLYHDEKDGKYHLSLFHNGLTGAAGVLPVAYTEWLIERKLRYNDDAPKAFMNMFDHRMYCLSYLAWQKMHLSGDENRRDNNVPNNILLSLGGVTPQTISMTAWHILHSMLNLLELCPDLNSYSHQYIKSECPLILFVV